MTYLVFASGRRLAFASDQVNDPTTRLVLGDLLEEANMKTGPGIKTLINCIRWTQRRLQTFPPVEPKFASSRDVPLALITEGHLRLARTADVDEEWTSDDERRFWGANRKVDCASTRRQAVRAAVFHGGSFVGVFDGSGSIRHAARMSNRAGMALTAIKWVVAGVELAATFWQPQP